MALARWLAAAAFAVALPIFLITTNLRYVVNAEDRYREGFLKYDIPAVTGISLDQLMVGARGLIAYFNSGQAYVDITVQRNGQPFRLFNEREVLHLKDVKALLQLMFRLNLAALAYIVFYVAWLAAGYRGRLWRRLAASVLAGAVLTVGFFLLVGGLALVDFDRVFLEFHLLSFRNDLWQLDPRTDYLIAMYPQGFFYDATYFLALSTFVEALLLGVPSALYLRLRPRRPAPVEPAVAKG